MCYVSPVWVHGPIYDRFMGFYINGFLSLETHVVHTKPLIQSLSESRGGSKVTQPILVIL